MPTNNYTLGRGKVHFSRFIPGTFTPAGFRYIGNTPEFSLNIESEELDHYNSDEGIREKDDSVSLEVNRTGSLITDNIDPKNVALFFFGTDSVVVQAPVAEQTLTIQNVLAGHSYKIGATTTNPTGYFGIDPANFSAAIGATDLVAGTDYVLDADSGIVTFDEDSTLVVDGVDVAITFTVRGSSRDRVISGSQPVEGAMMYVTRNPKGQDSTFYLPYVKVMPNGDYALKGDEWQQIPLSLEVLKREDTEAILRDGRPVYA
jgi:hypothetical protein